jgi:hypothetical protein
MSDKKIISMADACHNGQVRSPEAALRDAINDVGKEGALEHGKKVLILALDETDGNYGVTFYQAGMKMSECLALCEVAKILFLQDMEYIPAE